jgi:hypothetical protein
MRERLSTHTRARRPGSGLSGPIFSGPDDWGIFVLSLQIPDINDFFGKRAEHFDAGGIRELEQKSNSSPITLETNVMPVMDRKHQAFAGCLAE